MTNSPSAYSTHFQHFQTWGFKKRPAPVEVSLGRFGRSWLSYYTAPACNGNATGCNGKASKEEHAYRTPLRGKWEGWCYCGCGRNQVSVEEVGAEAADAMSDGTLHFASPVIIYKALKAAAIDGLASKEFQGIYVIADKMGATEDLKSTRSRIWSSRRVAPKKKKRIALCVRRGHPSLDDKYKFSDMAWTSHNGKWLQLNITYVRLPMNCV